MGDEVGVAVKGVFEDDFVPGGGAGVVAASGVGPAAGEVEQGAVAADVAGGDVCAGVGQRRAWL